MKVVRTNTQLLLKDPWYDQIPLGADIFVVLWLIVAIGRGLTWLCLVPFPTGRRRINERKRRRDVYQTPHLKIDDIWYVTTQTDHKGHITVTVHRDKWHSIKLVARGRAARRLAVLMSPFPAGPAGSTPAGHR